MKKLIVIMCAAVIGFAAQASSVNWSFSWATNADTSDLADGSMAYLMNVATMSVADAQAALTAKTFDASKAIDSGATSTAGGNGAELSQVKSGLSLTGEQTFYVVLISGDNYGITSTITKSMATIGDTVVGFQELSDDSGVPTLAVNWAPGGVAGGGQGGGDGPEPTSGLLLLVGAGVLGLRRKRA